MSDQATDRDPFEAEFAQRVNVARHGAGLTAAALGAEIGISGMSIANYENAAHLPVLGTANRLAIALGYAGIGDFLAACPDCMGFRHPDWDCHTCGGALASGGDDRG